MVSVPTYPPGTSATASDLAWPIASRPLCGSSLTSTQAAANNSWTTANLPTVALDRDSGHFSNGYTVGKTLGMYIVSGQITLAASTAGTTRQARIVMNLAPLPGATVILAPPSLSSPRAIVVPPTPIIATVSTDFVQIQVFHDSGGSLNITSAELTVEYVGSTNVLEAPVTSTSSSDSILGTVPVPGVPVFGSATTSTYQPADGFAKATVTLAWTKPLNLDGTLDGWLDHYDIQYRPTGTSNWENQTVPADSLGTTITALSLGTSYDFQIRAINGSGDAIQTGAWSGTLTQVTSADVTAPGQPAPPTVAASLIAVQVTHQLGLNSGGTFNLPPDLSHLEVHLGAASGFTPDATTLAGKLQADAGMLTAGIAAVGTFKTTSTAAVWVKVVAVDRSGNRSTPSSAASATATLIDTAHISDLTVTKLTAGTLSVAVVLSGSIKTSTSGSRVEIDGSGVRAYNSSGTNTVNISASTGNATITGVFTTAVSGQRITVDSSGTFPTITMLDSGGATAAYINSPGSGIGVNTGNWTSSLDGTTVVNTRSFLLGSGGGRPGEIVRVSDQARFGAYVDINNTAAEIGFLRTGQTARSFAKAENSKAEISAYDSGGLLNTVYASDAEVQINTDPNDDPFNIQLGDGTMNTVGRVANMSGNSLGMFLHFENGISANTNFSVSYGATMATQVDNVVTNEAGMCRWVMTGSSSTGYSLSQDVNQSVNLNFVGMRR